MFANVAEQDTESIKELSTGVKKGRIGTSARSLSLFSRYPLGGMGAILTGRKPKTGALVFQVTFLSLARLVSS